MADFTLLYRVSDIPPQIFARLDPSSLALAACVCRAWRDLARACNAKVRGSTEKLFRLILADLLASAPTLAWVVANLNEKRIPATLQYRVCALAAARGFLTALQWAHTNGYHWDAGTCANAANGGHLAVLRWAHKNGCPWSKFTCPFAAENGHLAVLQWARTNGCPWDELTCAFAARGGHLAVLQWARENGCPWNELTCEGAAGHGHLAVLQWARANKCPWDKEDCLIQATDRGHKAVVAWILAQPE